MLDLLTGSSDEQLTPESIPALISKLVPFIEIYKTQIKTEPNDEVILMLRTTKKDDINDLQLVVAVIEGSKIKSVFRHFTVKEAVQLYLKGENEKGGDQSELMNLLGLDIFKE